MGAGGGKTENHVTGLHLASVNNLALLNHADREAREVILAFRIHARHFSGFAADQSAASEFAAVSDALHDTLRDADIQLAAGEVVEEEDVLRTLHQNVIHAHRHQILTDRIVTVQLEGEHQLRADAVSAGHEDGFLVFLADFEKCAEAADGTENARDQSTLGKGLDALNQFVSVINGNAGCIIGELSHE